MRGFFVFAVTILSYLFVILKIHFCFTFVNAVYVPYFSSLM